MTEEERRKIEQSWNTYGACPTCGWHSSFWEKEGSIIPDILVPENWEFDDKFDPEHKEPLYRVHCSNPIDNGCKPYYLQDFLIKPITDK